VHARDLLTGETPLTNAERVAAWRGKLAGWQLERWYELAHPDAPALEIESPAQRTWRATLPSLVRWQAE
jgi:hypothetical protein